MEEVELAVNQCKTKKAVGLDGVPNELLKNKHVMRLLLSLFNVCFEHGFVPEQWKKAIIHPIPKTKESSRNPLDYHGMALQSCIFKLFSTILNNRIVDHLEETNQMTEEQNGFR